MESATQKRGRKPKGDAPMSGRDRTFLYRQRRKRELIEAIGQESQASTAVLAERLREEFIRLAKADQTVDATVTKNSITRILRELCRRYRIEVGDVGRPVEPIASEAEPTVNTSAESEAGTKKHTVKIRVSTKTVKIPVVAYHPDELGSKETQA